MCPIPRSAGAVRLRSPPAHCCGRGHRCGGRVLAATTAPHHGSLLCPCPVPPRVPPPPASFGVHTPPVPEPSPIWELVPFSAPTEASPWAPETTSSSMEALTAEMSLHSQDRVTWPRTRFLKISFPLLRNQLPKSQSAKDRFSTCPTRCRGRPPGDRLPRLGGPCDSLPFGHSPVSGTLQGPIQSQVRVSWQVPVLQGAGAPGVSPRDPTRGEAQVRGGRTPHAGGGADARGKAGGGGA